MPAGQQSPGQRVELADDAKLLLTQQRGPHPVGAAVAAPGVEPVGVAAQAEGEGRQSVGAERGVQGAGLVVVGRHGVARGQVQLLQERRSLTLPENDRHYRSGRSTGKAGAADTYLEARQLAVCLLQVLRQDTGGQRAHRVLDVDHVHQGHRLVRVQLGALAVVGVVVPDQEHDEWVAEARRRAQVQHRRGSRLREGPAVGSGAAGPGQAQGHGPLAVAGRRAAGARQRRPLVALAQRHFGICRRQRSLIGKENGPRQYPTLMI